MSLTICQREVLNKTLNGCSVLISGSAGTGKSFLTRHIITQLKLKNGTKNIGVVAPTGIAASNIDGTTIHAWAGIGIGEGDIDALIKKVRSNKPAYQRWKSTRALIIDEISMLDGDLFTKLNNIAQAIRSNSRPFGGIQLILVGDFYQLPPVQVKENGFAFECDAWNDARIQKCELTEVIRQKGDDKFIEVLNKIRVGQCPDYIVDILEKCHVDNKPPPTDGIIPTKLYCMNRDVDRENSFHLERLPESSKIYKATDLFGPGTPFGAEQKLTEMLDKKMQRTLELKIGAQVMLTKNMVDFNLVNGSRGIVHDFAEHGAPIVKFANGVIMTMERHEIEQKFITAKCTRSQYPLKLGWALTIHKAQGSTIERAEIQVSGAFAAGQTYVAVSRCTTLNGMWIAGDKITKRHIFIDPKVVNFYCI